MNTPLPEHHSNPETFMDDPVYIFTDKAIVPPPKDNGSATSPASEDEKPKDAAPDDPQRGE